MSFLARHDFAAALKKQPWCAHGSFGDQKHVKHTISFDVGGWVRESLRKRPTIGSSTVLTSPAAVTWSSVLLRQELMLPSTCWVTKTFPPFPMALWRCCLLLLEQTSIQCLLHWRFTLNDNGIIRGNGTWGAEEDERLRKLAPVFSSPSTGPR